MVGSGDGKQGTDSIVRRSAGQVEIQAGDVGIHVHRLHIPLGNHDGQETFEAGKGVRQERAAVRDHDLGVGISDQHIMCDHVKDCPCGFGKVFIRRQRHF